MGELMRQYWIPAAMSRELRSNDAPMRLMLLGERLIAFRDGSGKIGVMDHRCPHRFASLFYGRNEYDGIRCVYHGFEYDVDGNCLDMPNVPPQYDYKNKIKAKAYKTLERNGLIWVYMGPRTEPPGLPASNPLCFPKIRSSCSSANAIAIGYRPWRATSTPRIWAFSIGAASMPTISPKGTSPVMLWLTAVRSCRRLPPILEQCTVPGARHRVRFTGAFPLLLSHSGRCHRRVTSVSI